jgi:4-hydroxybenzoate polyprenyltransferase
LIPNLSVGLLVLTQLTSYSIIAAFGIIPIVMVYPLMKRYTNYPQFVLGLAFNWGVIVAYLARTT